MNLQFPCNKASHLGRKLLSLLLLVPAILLLGQCPLTAPPLAAGDSLQVAGGEGLVDCVLKEVGFGFC